MIKINYVHESTNKKKKKRFCGERVRVRVVFKNEIRHFPCRYLQRAQRKKNKPLF